MKRIRIIGLILVVIFLVGIAACSSNPPAASTTAAPKTTTPAAAPQVIQWRLQSYAPDEKIGTGHIPYAWSQDMEYLTGGRFKAPVLAPGAVAQPADMFQAVSTGTLDAAYIWPTFYRGVVPEGDVQAGPAFAWPRLQEAWAAYYTYGLLAKVREVYAAKNVYFLAPTMTPTSFQFYSRDPIRGPADLKGKKFLSGNAAAMSIAADRYGAAPVSIPPAERYMAMKTGVVDVLHTGIRQAESMAIPELIKYVTDPLDVGATAGSFVVNMDSWKKLPEDVRNLLEKYSAYSMDRNAIVADEPSYLKTFITKFNLTWVEWPAEDKAALWDYAVSVEWKKLSNISPAAAGMMDIIMKQMKDMGRIK